VINTVTVDIVRKGISSSHLLVGDLDYIGMCGAYPQADLKINCTQQEFIDWVQKLRYGSDDKDRQQAIAYFQNLVTQQIFIKIPELLNQYDQNEWIHLRLLITARELAQLPFELVMPPMELCGDNKDVFPLCTAKRVTFTRETKQMGGRPYKWPVDSRVLFAWAQPGNPVPFQQHWDA
jgi:hypothetical protein